MRIFLIIGTAFLILLGSAAISPAQQWTRQKSGTLAWLRGIFFINENHGWAVGGSGTILTTNDGGKIWTIVKSPTNDNIRDVFYSNEQTGWLLCEKSQFQMKNGERRSYLLKTADGGSNWEKIDFSGGNGNEFVTRLIFFDKQQAYATGEAGSLFKLQPDGKTFLKQSLETRYLLFGGAFADARNGVIVGAGKTILLTNDGGASWREATVLSDTGSKIYAADFVTSSLGWAVGAEGKIFVTLDGGKNWRTQKSGITANLFDLKFTAPNEGWAIGEQGAILHTKNAGATWNLLEAQNNHALEKLFFINHRKGWAVGFGGTILSFGE